MKFSLNFEWDIFPRESTTLGSISVFMFILRHNISHTRPTVVLLYPRKFLQHIVGLVNSKPGAYGRWYLIRHLSVTGFDRILYTFTGYTLDGISFHRSSHMFGCLGFSRTTQTLHLIYFLPIFCPFSLPSLAFLFYQLFFLNIVYALVGFLFLLTFSFLTSIISIL